MGDHQIALRIINRTISTTVGLKSSPPKVGRALRIWPNSGSVIWNTSWFNMSRIGCGRDPLMGTMNERIDLAMITTIIAIKTTSTTIKN